MSQGKSAKHVLRSLRGLTEAESRDELNRWAGRLPIGLIGCIVEENDTLTAPATDWVSLTWSSVLHETDHFFPAVSDGAQTEMTVPPELGGAYVWHTTMEITTESPLFTWQLVHVNAYDDAVSVLAENLEFVTGSLFFIFTYSIPKVLHPGDKVYFRFGAFIGESVDFDVDHTTMFYRQATADFQP